MKFVNCTPHPIVLNDGTTFPPSGNVARVSDIFGEFNKDCICSHSFGEVTGIPDPVKGVKIIVSSLVLDACGDRDDLVAPATGHPECKRSSKGFIASVPGFRRD